MDDEQGPWWTRPPEPGRVQTRDEGRDTSPRPSGTSPDTEEASDPYETEVFRPGTPEAAPRAEQPSGPPPSGRRAARAQSPAVMPPADFAPPTVPGRNPPETGVPPQGGWPDATPVPQTPGQPPYPPPGQMPYEQPALPANAAASTMPLPMIDEDELGEPYGDLTQPAPVAPKPPKSPIRRVAAPEPPPAPPKPPKPPKAKRTGMIPADRNAYAPPQNGDIWATFSGPIALPDEELAKQGRAPQQPAPLRPPPGRAPLPPRGDDGQESPLKRFLTVQKPEARFVLLGVAGGLVVLLIVVVALLSGQGNDSETPATTASASATASGKDATGLTAVKQLKAKNLLRRAGASAGGTVVEAFSWEDKNGLNLAAAVRVNSSNGKTTLNVVQVAGLESGGDPRVLRSMTDPDLPQCGNGRAGGQASFAKVDSQIMQIRDLDSNGYAEVIVGWSSRCGNKSTSSEAKMALITNGNKYIIRGSGVVGADSGSTAAEPAAGKWPEGFYEAASQRYATVFFPVGK